MIFDERDYAKLATLFKGVSADPEFPFWTGPSGPAFPPYAGYKPETREAPNGDTKLCPECGGLGDERWRPCKGACRGTGRVPNVDASKRYLHVALKYNPPEWALKYLARAHWEACRVAEALGVPAEFYPRTADGTLRVLEYPAGAGSAEHTDFDLFTILCWRSHPEDLELYPELYPEDGHHPRLEDARAMSPGLHIGELGELAGLGPATPHRVPARPYVQRSIVYFAMPDHAARLPDSCICPRPDWNGHRKSCMSGLTVGEWLTERVARSRVTGYK